MMPTNIIDKEIEKFDKYYRLDPHLVKLGLGSKSMIDKEEARDLFLSSLTTVSEETIGEMMKEVEDMKYDLSELNRGDDGFQLSIFRNVNAAFNEVLSLLQSKLRK